MRRPVMLFGGWALATLAATGIGLLALGSVTDQVAPSAALPPPAAPATLETEQPLADATPPATAPHRPAGSAADDPPQPDASAQTQGYDLVGGVVTVRYEEGSARLVQAVPSSGFDMDVRDRGPAKVDIRFRSDDHESRFVAQWRDGAPVAERDERER